MADKSKDLQVLDKVRRAHLNQTHLQPLPSFFEDRVTGTATHQPDQTIIQAVRLIDPSQSPLSTAQNLDNAKNTRNQNIHVDQNSDLDSKIKTAIADQAKLPRLEQALNQHDPLVLKILHAWPPLRVIFGLI